MKFSVPLLSKLKLSLSLGAGAGFSGSRTNVPLGLLGVATPTVGELGGGVGGCTTTAVYCMPPMVMPDGEGAGVVPLPVEYAAPVVPAPFTVDAGVVVDVITIDFFLRKRLAPRASFVDCSACNSCRRKVCFNSLEPQTRHKIACRLRGKIHTTFYNGNKRRRCLHHARRRCCRTPMPRHATTG